MELFKIYPSLDSTNNEAARLISSGESADGMTIMALDQTTGRGQYGREWHAEPGKHLAISIIFMPVDYHVNDLPAISMKTSLAICNVLRKLDPAIQPRIKWPNDIYVDGKKIAGILIENALQSQRLQHSIIGIGLNVNEEKFPANLVRATSLFMESKKQFAILEIAKLLRNEVLSLLHEKDPSWKEDYDHLIYQKGMQSQFELNNNKVSSVIEGVGMDGKLVLRHEDGGMKSYFAHELKWVV